MLGWFQTRASLARKLELAFGALSLAIAFAGGLAAGECARLLNASGAAPPAFQHAARDLAVVVTASAAVLFLASLLVGWATRRTAAGPLNALVRRIEGLASGDLESPIGFAEHEDDAGRLSRAMRMLQAEAAEAGRLKAECDERGRTIAVLLDSYYKLAAQAAGPPERPVGPRPAAKPSGLRALDAVFARPGGLDNGDDLRRLLRRLGSGARTPVESVEHPRAN